MTKPLPVLRASTVHLRSVIESNGELDPGTSAYPTDWSIANTMSHIGSGAVILKQRFEDVVTGQESDAGFNQSVWDEWNAKSPADQVSEALVADQALVLALEALSEEKRKTFRLIMGPFDLDFDGFVVLRLGEQALHTWDVEVAIDSTATLSSDVAEVILRSLPRLVAFTGKANDETKEVSVRTIEPARDLMIVFSGDSVSLIDAPHSGAVDVELPAEAFVRLVYGRLDAQHTPPGLNNDSLEALRKAFPGF
jgi:uncharacterized protein (TIGR03083 family)